MTAVEWLVDKLDLNVFESDEEVAEVIDQAKEMDKEQKKQLVIGTYLDLKMKNNKLSYGMEYLNKVSDLEEEAEQYYNKNFKSK